MTRILLALLLATALNTGAPALATHGQAAPLTIGQIQGAGLQSPYKGQEFSVPLRGCVTGVTAEGFFLQDPTGDGDRLTSDGIYVYRYSSWKNPRELKPGDLLELSSYRVTEFYGQTELTGLPSDKNTSYRLLGRCPLPSPAQVAMPSGPRVDLSRQYEAVEGMRVVIDVEGSVAGPTQRFESRHPAGDPEITVAPAGSPFYGRRIFASELPVNRGTLALSGGLGVDLPQADVLDNISAPGLTGVMAYQFGRYVLLVDNPSFINVKRTGGSTASPAQPPGDDEWTACTFNVENLFDAVDDGDGDVGDWSPPDDAAYHRSVGRRAALIREMLGGCTVVALQEVEGKDQVWADLAAAIGPNYQYDYYESVDARDITAGLIYDPTRVEVRQSGPAQACSKVDYGVDYASARGPRTRANPCADGLYPLHDRQPYVADLVIATRRQDRRMEVRIVVVHLKSKRGDEAENAPRRVQQAQHVAMLLDAPKSLALGDFNDDLGSQPLSQLASFVNLYERHTPPTDRYSYIYNGRAQAVDYAIMTPELDRFYLNGGPVHANADFGEPLKGAEGRTSDHDPLIVRFLFRPTGISDALVGAASGATGATAYHQSLRLK